jgi:hypothetical protein
MADMWPCFLPYKGALYIHVRFTGRSFPLPPLSCPGPPRGSRRRSAPLRDKLCTIAPIRSLEDSMQNPESSLEALANRIAKLEAQNRRLKKAGIAAFFIAATVVTMGQSKPAENINTATIRAGRIFADYIELESKETGATTSVIPGLMVVKYKGGSVSIDAKPDSGPSLHVISKEDGGLTMVLPGVMVNCKGGSVSSFGAGGDGPSLTLSDKEGFEASLGVSSLVTAKTGETHRTSAASVVLFGKDKKVLWSAP